MNPFDSVEIKLPKVKEKVSIEILISEIEGLADLEEDEDGELPYYKYYLKENAVNQELDSYLKTLGIPTLNFLEKWRDTYIPDNSKQIALLSKIEEIPAYQLEAVR